MSVLIITGGRIDEIFAFDFLQKNHFDHILVVDGALAFWDKLEKMGNLSISFDHLVGDFDTIDHRILERYLGREDITVHRFNPVKDNTDTDIAIRIATHLSEGEREPEICLIGATGTRLDHSLANLQLLELMRADGVRASIVDQYNRISLFDGYREIKKEEQFGEYVSLIPISDELVELSIKGMKYNLDKLTVKRGGSLLVSNEITEDTAVLEMKEGLAYLIESRD